MKIHNVKMINKVYARPVIPLLIAFMSGISLGSRFCGYDGWAYFLVAVCMLAICFGIKQKKSALMLPPVLMAALGYLCIQPWSDPVFPAGHVVHYADSRARQIIGTIDSPPIASPRHLKFTLNVESLGAAATAFPASGRIQVSVWGIHPQLSSGDRIAFSGKIRLIRNFNNPGRFDYKRYMDFEKIWGTAHTQAKKLKILTRSLAAKHVDRVATARNKISELIEKTAKDEPRGVLKALIVGDRSHISVSMRTAFNRAGVGHLLAISGLHIGIVATAAFFCFRWLLAFIRPFLWHAWTRKGAALLTLVPVLIYGLLAGMSPSTQRAVMMVGIFLLTILLEREQDLLNTLAVAAMVILIVHPPSLFSISFQLSFCAVLFIIYGLSSLQGIYANPMGRFKIFRKLIVFILVSFFAIIGTLPLVMRYFNQVSLVGLLTNIVFIPLIGFVVVPLGLMAVFVYPLSNPAALWCLKVGAAILNPSLNMIRLVAGLPFAAINTLTPTKVEIVCYYGLVWTLLNLMRNRLQPANAGGNVLRPEPGTISRDNENPSATATPHARTHAGRIYETMRRTWQRAVSKSVLLKVVMVIIALVGCVDIGYWLYYRLGHQDLRVTVMDVGQGSAALLELPGGYNLLIDGGGFSTNSTFDAGTRIVAPLLRQKKIRTVETLILSHPNSDHLNGLLYIAEHFNVKQVWTNSQASETGSYQQLKAIIAKNKIHMPEFKEIPRDHEINGVYLKILYPPGDFIEKSQTEKWRNLNNNSMVIQVRMGSTTFLFLGDIMFPAEAELVSSAGAELKSTVLMAPHHGSRKSSSDVLLNAVRPAVVIISAGWKNRFRFPHSSVLKKYHQRGYRIFRTDTNGAITITTDGKDLNIKPYLISSKP